MDLAGTMAAWMRAAARLKTDSELASVSFVDSLPTTGTQKIQKHNIYPAGVDPRGLPDIIDLRELKRRERPA